MGKQNAPGPEAEGVVCLHSRADTDAYNITALRCQHLRRLGVRPNRSPLIAGLAFGEARHA